MDNTDTPSVHRAEGAWDAHASQGGNAKFLHCGTRLGPRPWHATHSPVTSRRRNEDVLPHESSGRAFVAALSAVRKAWLGPKSVSAVPVQEFSVSRQ